MDALYGRTSGLIREAQARFADLRGSASDADAVEEDIRRRIDEITAHCERLDVLAFKAPAVQRPAAKMRCDQLKYDVGHLRAALEASGERRARARREAEERERLLGAPLGAPDTAVAPDSSGARDRFARSLDGAHRGVDDMLATGSDVLVNLRNQRETLKGAHRRILAVAETLGLSDATVTLIRRRARQDGLVLVGGMLLTLVVIGVVLYLA